MSAPSQVTTHLVLFLLVRKLGLSSGQDLLKSWYSALMPFNMTNCLSTILS
jgi:hypothetical protein